MLKVLAVRVLYKDQKLSTSLTAFVRSHSKSCLSLSILEDLISGSDLVDTMTGSVKKDGTSMCLQNIHLLYIPFLYHVIHFFLNRSKWPADANLIDPRFIWKLVIYGLLYSWSLSSQAATGWASGRSGQIGIVSQRTGCAVRLPLLQSHHSHSERYHCTNRDSKHFIPSQLFKAKTTTKIFSFQSLVCEEALLTWKTYDRTTLILEKACSRFWLPLRR